MTTQFARFAGLFLSLSSLAPLAHASAPEAYIVNAPRASLVAAIKSEVARAGGQLLIDLPYHEGRVFTATLTQAQVQSLRARVDESVWIEKDVEVSINRRPPSGGGGGSAPAQVTPWGITRIGAPDAWADASYGTRGAGVVVCVVDTGIQKDHPDLHAGITGQNFVASGRKPADPAAWGDGNGHGTHVAGTIAALDNTIGAVGVAPAATLMAARVLNSQGTGTNSGVASGIRYCADNGADVISMSLGSPSGTATLQDAVQYASSLGVILVAAAGNDYGAPVSYPAAYPEVLAVSSTESDDSLSSFSNVGPQIAFAAPGGSIYSTYIGSSYSTLSGTSMATPHVSGVAALMIASGSLGLVGEWLGGLTANQQGAGLIDALATVLNQ